jgi:hypothetical protein
MLLCGAKKEIDCFGGTMAVLEVLQAVGKLADLAGTFIDCGLRIIQSRKSQG